MSSSRLARTAFLLDKVEAITYLRFAIIIEVSDGPRFCFPSAARPKQAKHGSEPEPKQVKHGNKVIADRLYRLPAKLLISQPDRIVTRHRGRCGPSAPSDRVEELNREIPVQS